MIECSRFGASRDRKGGCKYAPRNALVLLKDRFCTFKKVLEMHRMSPKRKIKSLCLVVNIFLLYTNYYYSSSERVFSRHLTPQKMEATETVFNPTQTLPLFLQRAMCPGTKACR